MTKKQYLKFHREFCQKMVAITAQKNADYTGKSDDPFANFRTIELLGVTSVEAGFITRITDKLRRICTFVQKGVLLVKEESVEDTLMDTANYCALLAGYLHEKRENTFKARRR